MMQIHLTTKALLLFSMLIGSLFALPFNGDYMPPQKLTEYQACKYGCGKAVNLCDLRCNYHTGYLLGLSTLECQRNCADTYWQCYLNCAYG